MRECIYISKSDWEKYFINNSTNCFLPIDSILKTGQHIKFAKYNRRKYDFDGNRTLYQDRSQHNIIIKSKHIHNHTRRALKKIEKLDYMLGRVIRSLYAIGWATTSSCIGHYSDKTDFYDKNATLLPNEDIDSFYRRSYLGSVLSEPDDDDLAYFYINFRTPHPEMKDWEFVINETDYTIFHKHKKMSENELKKICVQKAINDHEIWCCLNKDCTSIMAWCPKKKEAIYAFHKNIISKIMKCIKNNAHS